MWLRFSSKKQNQKVRNRKVGFLGGNNSTTIIDTSLYGDITIEITLASSDCLMLSNPTGILASYSAGTNAEYGIASTHSYNT